jgi:hypothetical protein
VNGAFPRDTKPFVNSFKVNAIQFCFKYISKVPLKDKVSATSVPYPTALSTQVYGQAREVLPSPLFCCELGHKSLKSHCVNSRFHLNRADLLMSLLNKHLAYVTVINGKQKKAPFRQIYYKQQMTRIIMPSVCLHDVLVLD